jgi:hypothetical protein
MTRTSNPTLYRLLIEWTVDECRTWGETFTTSARLGGGLP